MAKMKPKVYINPETLVSCSYCGTGFNYMLGNCPNCGGANDKYDDVVREAEEKQRQYEADVHNREMDKIHNTNTKAKANIVFKILSLGMIALNLLVALPLFIYSITYLIKNLF